MGKEMTLSKINMYERMLRDDFEPTIKILEARGDAIKESVEVEVRRELGLYALLLEKAKLEFQLGEIKERIRSKTKKENIQVAPNRWEYRSLLEREIERKMEVVNAPLIEAKSFRDNLMREIKLSSGTPEIRALFAKLGPEVAKWRKKAEFLPPLKLKQLSKQDREVLGIQLS